MYWYALNQQSPAVYTNIIYAVVHIIGSFAEAGQANLIIRNKFIRKTKENIEYTQQMYFTMLLSTKTALVGTQISYKLNAFHSDICLHIISYSRVVEYYLMLFFMVTMIIIR